MIPGPSGAGECHLLFVYGTLRRGFELHHHLAALARGFWRKRKSPPNFSTWDAIRGRARQAEREDGFAAKSSNCVSLRRDLRVLDEVEGFSPRRPGSGASLSAPRRKSF